MHDTAIINGLINNHHQRARFEKEFYLQYKYFIGEGCRKYQLSYEDSFSAYSDALLGAINNIVNKRFDGRVTLKTYLYQIYHNKCVDLIRKISNNRQKVHKSTVTPALLSHLPDTAKGVIEKLIDQEKAIAIKQFLEIIGEKCKEILLLFEDGFTDKEIAEKLAFNSPAVAKTSRLRCRQKIKILFTNYG